MNDFEGEEIKKTVAALEVELAQLKAQSCGCKKKETE